jgi:hypothetical protein
LRKNIFKKNYPGSYPETFGMLPGVDRPFWTGNESDVVSDFAEGNPKWRKRLFAALGCLLPGGWILSLTLF